MTDGGAPDVAGLLAEARHGSRRALGRLFTEAEDAAVSDVRIRAFMLALQGAAAGSPAGPRHVVGLTGPPGAGKSSLAAALTGELTGRGRRVAVLAVDPSSPRSGGALLGDRVRFADTAPASPPLGDGDPADAVPRLLVRSIASRGHGGGIARAVPTAIAVAVALGFDDVLVETVGSGQGEIAVTSAVDTTLLVAAPGLGDEIQASKAGIAELADIICVTKADLPGAAQAAAQWRAALRTAAGGEWQPRVVLVSSRTPDITELVTALDDRREWLVQHPGRTSPPEADTAFLTAGEAAWHRAIDAAALGDLAATIALLGGAMLAGAGQDQERVDLSALTGTLTVSDLDPERLATPEGLRALVTTVRGRIHHD